MKARLIKTSHAEIKADICEQNGGKARRPHIENIHLVSSGPLLVLHIRNIDVRTISPSRDAVP